MLAVNNPEDENAGKRPVKFSREIYIERDDFMEAAPKKFFRLKPDGEVRLRNAFIIRCDEVIRNEAGEIDHLICSFDPDSRSGLPGASRKVKGTIHWVSVEHGVRARFLPGGYNQHHARPPPPPLAAAVRPRARALRLRGRGCQQSSNTARSR